MQDLIFRGPVYGSSGYATAGRNFLLALDQSQQYRIMLDPLRWASGFSVSEGRETLLALKRLEKQRDVLPQRAALLHWSIASEFEGRLGCARAIGHSTFETHSLLKSFVAGCNAMDAIMVPTEFNRRTFVDAGVKVPIHVVPEGVDTARFCPVGARLSAIPARFTFLSLAQLSYRKGADLVLKAFLELFPGHNDVQLVTRWYFNDSAPKDLEAVSRFVSQYRSHEMRGQKGGHVFMLNSLPEAHLPAFYRSGHALVAPFRGEGWGLPIIEALACEVPVIATNWGGPLAYLNPEMAILLDYSLQPIPERVADGWLGPHLKQAREEGHLLAEPDFEQLKAAMWDMYQNYFVHKAQAVTAREHLLSHFQWHHAMPAFHAMMEAVWPGQKNHEPE